MNDHKPTAKLRTLEKAVRCAMIEGKGWKQEMYRFLRRTTPHSSTGIPLATARLNRSIRTTLPEIKTPLFDKTMSETDAAAKFRMNQYADRRTNAKPSNLQPGDIVLVKQRSVNKNSTPYKPTTYEVVARKGTMITANNDDHTITRNISRFKPVKIKIEPSVLPTEDDPLDENLSSGDRSTDMSLEESTTPSPVDSPIYSARSTRNQENRLG